MFGLQRDASVWEAGTVSRQQRQGNFGSYKYKYWTLSVGVKMKKKMWPQNQPNHNNNKTTPKNTPGFFGSLYNFFSSHSIRREPGRAWSLKYLRANYYSFEDFTQRMFVMLCYFLLHIIIESYHTTTVYTKLRHFH